MMFPVVTTRERASVQIANPHALRKVSACRPGDLLRLPDGALAIAGSRRPNEDLPAFVIRLAAGSTDAIPVMHDHESGPDNAIVSDEDVLTMPSPSIRVHHEVSPSCSLQTLARPGMIALTHDGYLLIYKQDDTLMLQCGSM